MTNMIANVLALIFMTIVDIGAALALYCFIRDVVKGQGRQ